MKQFSVCLLLCITFAIGMVTTELSGDDCNNGVKAFKVFTQDCSQPVKELAKEYQKKTILSGNEMKTIVGRYCSTTMPAVRNCFNEKIKQCDSAAQTLLQNKVNQTGFICIPGTTTVQNTILDVIHTVVGTQMSNNNCAASISPPDCRNFNEVMKASNGDSVDEFIPKVQEFFTEEARCNMQWYSGHKADCPDLVWKALTRIILDEEYKPTPLGLTFSLPYEEVTEAFKQGDVAEE